MNILLIEDNQDVAGNLLEYFEARGNTMEIANDGLTGLKLATTRVYDVLLLDLTLPGMDGLGVCQKLRASGNLVPVLMLTARDSLDDKVTGFQVGADDYVVKPFSMREVEARLLALVRRTAPKTPSVILEVGNLTFNTETYKVRRGNRDIVLPPIALKLLECLMRHSPRVLSREEIERTLWDGAPPDSDALRWHLHVLRNEIDSGQESPLIKTLRGHGYLMSDD